MSRLPLYLTLLLFPMACANAHRAGHRISSVHLACQSRSRY